MNSSEFRQRGREMVDYIADYLENIETRRVLPEVQPGYLRDMVPKEAPYDPDSWEEVMEDVERCIMPGITHWQHPRFHAYFPAGNSYPSILGDMLSDSIACVGFSWAASPACTELEILMLDWLAKMINLPQKFLHVSGAGGGVLQGSASDCVLVSMLVARNKALTDLSSSFKEQPEGVLLSKLVAYCSKLAHSCVEKAGMLSLVKMRELDIDENYSLRGGTLEKAIEDDRNEGLIPFYLCATLGTTAVCSYDNIKELGEICEKQKIWMHVDAAYAGSAFICPEFRNKMVGIEYARSFNMNPNKWLLVNFDCSALWVEDRKEMTNALTVDPLYLQHSQSDKAVDFRHWGIPLSRRFRSLKLWFVIRNYGVSGLQSYIRNHCTLAKLFESLVLTDGRFEVLGEVSLGLVCFRLKGHNFYTQMLMRSINLSGKLHMVPALINDSYVIRFAVCHQRAKEADIKYAWCVVLEMAAIVLETCKENFIEVAKVFEKIASLEIDDADEAKGDESQHSTKKNSIKKKKSDVKSSSQKFSNGDKPESNNCGTQINTKDSEKKLTLDFDGLGNTNSNETFEETDDNDDDEVFPFDDNIPSIPSIRSLPEPAAATADATAVNSNASSSNKHGKPLASYKRRNMLLRMISDPKLYKPQLLRSMSIERKKKMKVESSCTEELHSCSVESCDSRESCQEFATDSTGPNRLSSSYSQTNNNQEFESSKDKKKN
ncbi:hypothetical protein HELRODRAFT_101612 [Helobdella robusta]|uniref:Tyrosine decarboxylase n=1 Tax=Helobdella robusta TaxID=6412 RepID=T1ED58_HELRO|nr:hypothetical protein HELRODRAFT_101612 [Helobdella robusta]ESN98402.1 hypothetical protein HELRODRAFT_101612 [Helobdella robusta]